MNGKEFAKLIARDGGCVHCGEDEAIAPNHRANRGMGGVSKRSPLNLPSNLVVLCSRMNGLIESNPSIADEARRYGWKISKWENPLDVPVFYRVAGEWRLLDDNFGTRVVPHGREP